MTVWDGAISSQGFSRYRLLPSGMVSGVDYGTVKDPLGGSSTVGFLDSTRGLTLGNSSPRAQGETSRIIKPRAHGNHVDEYLLETTFMQPSRYRVPYGQWLTVVSPAYGPPYGGASPIHVSIVSNEAGSQMLSLGGKFAMIGKQFTVPLDQWVQLRIRFKFAYSGWVELSVKKEGEASWRALLIQGVRRFPMDTMRRNVNDGWYLDPRVAANSARIGAYGTKARIYFKSHRIASAGS